MIKYSFCTTCMDRLDHLEKTIFDNLNIIRNIGDSELVLVNYSSKQSIDKFVDRYLNYYLEKGLLVYISVFNKDRFYHSHAKNIVHKNSRGEFLINLDVDNLLTYKYVKIINNFFNQDENYIIRGTGKTGGYGRIALSRNNFFELGGYNEKLIHYGGEDTDLIERAEKYLKLKNLILQPRDVLHIKHDDALRNVNIGNQDIKTSYKKNRKIMDYYLNLDIKNPNEYENIEWGKL